MELFIDGFRVRLIRKPIRNLHLRVLAPSGEIQVSAPNRLPVSAVERFVREKKNWILRQQQLLASRPPATNQDYTDGQSVYLWGEVYRLRLQTAAHGRTVFQRENDIVLSIHPGDTPAQRQALLHSWYRAQLNAAILSRLPVWERQTGLHPSAVQIKNMKTRWGTCNTATKKIWLNLQLVKQPPICLDYVMVHELTHLLYPGHGQDFKAFLTRVMLDWQHIRKQLNKNTYQ